MNEIASRGLGRNPKGFRCVNSARKIKKSNGFRGCQPLLDEILFQIGADSHLILACRDFAWTALDNILKKPVTIFQFCRRGVLSQDDVIGRIEVHEYRIHKQRAVLQNRMRSYDRIVPAADLAKPRNLRRGIRRRAFSAPVAFDDGVPDVGPMLPAD